MIAEPCMFFFTACLEGFTEQNMAYQFRNITVLIVESSRPMFDLTKGVLTTFGVNQIYSAYGFDEAIQNVKKINPDLVIIDWLEDPNNGLKLTKTIRHSGDSPNPFVPIILMTGYSQKRRVVAARDSGITEFLVKPFTANALYQRIEQLIERPRDFVRCADYFGPDRRRRASEDYDGPERRGADNASSTAAGKARDINNRRDS